MKKKSPRIQPSPHNLIPLRKRSIHTRFPRHKYTPQYTKLPILGTNLLPIQLLIRRPRGTPRKLCLAKKLKLPLIALRILLVTPPAPEIKPRGWRLAIICFELVGAGSKLVVPSAEQWVPYGASVGVVFEDAAGEVEVRDCVVVGAAHGVVCVRAFGGVGDGADAGGVAFDGGVAEGLAVGVLREPDCGGLAVGEADHGVFPVADVVAWVICVSSVIRMGGYSGLGWRDGNITYQNLVASILVPLHRNCRHKSTCRRRLHFHFLYR